MLLIATSSGPGVFAATRSALVVVLSSYRSSSRLSGFWSMLSMWWRRSRSMFIRAAVSASLGSRPSSWARLFLVKYISRAILCLFSGMRMALPCLASTLVMRCLIHQVA